MKFTKIKIKNFFNLKNVDIDLNNRNTLVVGPNGSGKTNITKCVHFLVDKILEKYCGKRQHGTDQHQELPEIWNPNKECCIEVHACFNQDELKLFSKLRVLFLTAELCNFVFSVVDFGWQCFREVDEEGERDYDNNHYDIDVDEKKINAYRSLPSKIRSKIIDDIVEDADADHGYSSYLKLPDEVNLPFLVNAAGASELVTDFTKKVFPKLLAITNDLSLNGENQSGESYHHLEMKAFTQGSGKLEFSIHM